MLFLLSAEVFSKVFSNTLLTSQDLAAAKQLMDISLEDFINDFFFCRQKACELVLNVIKDLPYTHDRPPASNLAETSGAKGRQLWLTKCTESEILPYCIQLLLAALKVWIWFIFICQAIIRLSLSFVFCCYWWIINRMYKVDNKEALFVLLMSLFIKKFIYYYMYWNTLKICTSNNPKYR